MSCHGHLHDRPDSCTICHEVRVLVGLDDDGRPICGPCAGSTYNPHCQTCQKPGRHYIDQKCTRCVLIERIEGLLAGPDGVISDDLALLRDHFLAARSRPESMIRWLAHSTTTVALLRGIAQSGEPITHALLDELPLSFHEIFLRRLFVQAGVLAPRDEEIDRIPAWLDTVLLERPEHHAQLVRPFAHWHLLRRARRTDRRRRRLAAVEHDLRQRIRVTLDFLSWLDHHSRELGEIDQPVVDRWVADHKSPALDIRYFLNWARKRGIVADVRIHSQPKLEPTEFLDDTARWQILHRCLHDEALDTMSRAAGALILLFGLRASYVRQLTSDDLELRDNQAHLSTGQHQLLLPPKLAELLRVLAAVDHGRSRFVTANNAARWLFPGLQPGRPLTPSALGKKLRRLGLNARVARNTALIALAGDLPAPVLAELLGMHNGTAVRWARLAGRDWHAYIATRAVHTAGFE